MTLAVLAVLCLGPLSALLARASWTPRAPRWALTLWGVVGLVGWSAAITTGFTLLPNPTHASVLGQLRLFVTTSRRHAVAGLGPASVLGLSLSFDLVVVVGSVCVLAAWRAARERTALRNVIDVIGRPWRGVALLIPFPRPMAYFLPGRGGRVVLSSGLTDVADDPCLDAIVAHERAHQRAHHSSLALIPVALASQFSFIPWVRHGARVVPLWCEWAADDAARRLTSVVALRRALTLFQHGEATSPSCALAMNGASVALRLSRLDDGGRLWLAAALAWSVLIGCVATSTLLSVLR